MAARSYTRHATRDDGETEITVEIEVTSWGCEAQTYGDPSGCWSAEPMECEITKATFEGETGTYDVILTADEESRILQEFAENPPEDDYDDYDA